MSGASSVLGADIVDALRRGGHEVTATARRPRRADGISKLDLTEEDAVRAAARGHDTAVLCPILSTSAPAGAWMAEEGVERLVLFSSNNVAVDDASPVYEALREAEASLPEGRIVLRPTMIYGHTADQNLSQLMSTARRLGFLPCPGSGRAMQQPVFVRDLADAIVTAVDRATPPGTYAMGGPDTLTAKALFRAVLRASGKSSSAVLPLPLTPLKAISQAARALRVPFPLSPEQLARFEQDKRAVGQGLPGFTPKTGIEEGLKRLARDLADSASHG
ncbi:MAG: NAD(P)H-binding protein [Pseudomonadota bacterium]